MTQHLHQLKIRKVCSHKNDSFQSVWHLNTYPTKASLLSASNHLHYYGGATRTHEALDYVRNTMLTVTHGDRTSGVDTYL